MQVRTEEDLGLGEGGEGGEAGEGAEGAKAGSGLPWEGSDRDYSYEELLGECTAPGPALRGVRGCLSPAGLGACFPEAPQ